MLAVLDKSVAKCPEALQSPHSDSVSALRDGFLTQHFSSVHSGSVTVNLGSSGLIAYSMDKQSPLLPRMSSHSSASKSESDDLSFDTYGRWRQRGHHIIPRDERQHQGKLKWQAEKSIMWDIKKVHEDSPNCSREKQKLLVDYRLKNHSLKYKEARKILANDEQYERLRAEALAQPYVSYRPPSPESVGSYIAGPFLPPDSPGQTYPPPAPASPVYIDISSDSEEEDPEEPPMDETN